MPSNEIITGLKNAIDRKESLEQAMQIMINSGYSPEEVQEASKFISGGILNMQEPGPDEQLIMPDQKKSIFSRVRFWKKKSNQMPEFNQSEQIFSEGLQTSSQNPMPRETKIKGSLVQELRAIQPRKSSYLKEILLTIIFLILLAILALMFFFKDKIFG